MWQVFSLEFECSDDGQDSKRLICKLECEDGGERHRREKAAMDGIGPVVETLAQNGSQMDRDMLNERRVCHQRTSAQLGRTGRQNGLLRDLCDASHKKVHDVLDQTGLAVGGVVALSTGRAGCTCFVRASLA